MSRTPQRYQAIIAVLGWFALISQFYINATSNDVALFEITIRYFSYFTILTNLLITVYCSVRLLAPESALAIFFSKQSTGTAIAVYITVVGVVYNMILRSMWDPEGLQLVVDEVLHTIIPILFIGYWILRISRHELAWRNVWYWLLYPFMYSIFILVRGNFSGFYPYPFVNVTSLGYNQVFINCLVLTAVFILFSFLFIWIAKLMSRHLI
ncbi:MAG TPA: Pr6Pr family membrane protein [Cyclobacteriaceae bacterium]